EPAPRAARRSVSRDARGAVRDGREPFAHATLRLGGGGGHAQGPRLRLGQPLLEGRMSEHADEAPLEERLSEAALAAMMGDPSEAGLRLVPEDGLAAAARVLALPDRAVAAGLAAAPVAVVPPVTVPPAAVTAMEPAVAGAAPAVE